MAVELIDRNKPVMFGCCFCGKNVDAKKMCWITVSLDVDPEKYIGSQTYWSHKKCLKGSLDKISRENFVVGDKK